MPVPNWKCVAGNTLLIPSGPQGNHLFIVLTNPADIPDLPPQSCLSVSLCTIRTSPYDLTCIVQAGEHPFVVSSSYISYRHARIDQAIHFEKMVDACTFFPHVPVSADLFTRIYSGIHASKQTPNYIKLNFK